MQNDTHGHIYFGPDFDHQELDDCCKGVVEGVSQLTDRLEPIMADYDPGTAFNAMMALLNHTVVGRMQGNLEAQTAYLHTATMNLGFACLEVGNIPTPKDNLKQRMIGIVAPMCALNESNNLLAAGLTDALASAMVMCKSKGEAQYFIDAVVQVLQREKQNFPD